MNNEVLALTDRAAVRLLQEEIEKLTQERDRAIMQRDNLAELLEMEVDRSAGRLEAITRLAAELKTRTPFAIPELLEGCCVGLVEYDEDARVLIVTPA